MIGLTLSHYRITAALGAGGMGEVYRATDTSLGRDVAIKVLPAEVAHDPERLARFRREAHLLASLNHPNVAAIHGLEEADGKPFLVLELVEGEDLRQRLARGAIPVEEALEIAAQVAEALEEAHGRGIVHRDLKPANVKLTPGGKVKVLDFGLAKAWAGDGSGASSAPSALSQSPTLANTGTVAGVILGTAAYMSPEQARGKPVDKRADVWSFGVLLWEMLTGRQLFCGDTVTDVIAAVVTQAPDLDALPAGTPRAVRRTLGLCLRKDPRRRLPDIGAARLELEEARTAEDAWERGAIAGAAAVAQRRRRERLLAGALVVAAGCAASLAVLRFSAAPEPRLAAHFVLDVPEGQTLYFNGAAAVSPDGRTVAWAAGSGGSSRLWIRPLDSPETRELPGTEGARAPFWSPDSASIAFAARGELRRRALASGSVQRICTLPWPWLAGGTWNAAGTIVFATGSELLGAGRPLLFSVPAAGGEARPLAAQDSSGRDPSFLPDGRHLLFTVPDGQEAGVYLTSIDAPEKRRRVLAAGSRAGYASGHLLFVLNGVLLAQPFDPRSLEVSGEASPVAASAGGLSASLTGVLAYREAGATSREQLTWRNRKGETLGRLGEPARYEQIVLSPDERRVAAEIWGDSGVDLWTIDVVRGVASRLTNDPGAEVDPVWSPDSQELAYGSTQGVGGHFLFRRGLRGGPAVTVPGARGTGDTTRDRAEDWSPDGKALLLKKLNGTTVWALPLEGGGEPEPVLELSYRLDEPRISPDGRWLAYTSEDSGRWEVYVQPFRRPGEKVRVSVDGGGQPEWRGDGREIFFLGTDGRLMAVEVGAGTAAVEVSLPTPLFEVERGRPDLKNYAVSADGQRFLVKVPVERGAAERIHVVTNWTSLLERR